MILHPLDLCRSERKKERGQTGFGGWTDERGPTFGGPSQHSVTSLSNRIRPTDGRYWVGQRDFFVLVGACCREIEYIAIGARETHARSAPLSPPVGPALLRTTINSWVILIATPRTRSGWPGLSPRPVGINSFNERVRVALGKAHCCRHDLSLLLPRQLTHPRRAFLDHRWAVSYARDRLRRDASDARG